MNQVKLHYIYDPLCGWCYGAAPLIKIAREIIAVQAHAGGMMTGDRRRAVTPELRQFVVAHDQRIAQISGQPFGDAYFNGLLRDEGAVFDSEPPITAVLAAEQVAQRGLELLARMQTAHYIEGLRIADSQVLHALAVEIGIDGSSFDRAFEQISGAATRASIENSRALMETIGAHGFPTLALEQDQTFVVLNITQYLGRMDAWRAWLTQQVVASTEAAGEGFMCGREGCIQ